MEQCNKTYVPVTVTVQTFETQDIVCSSEEVGALWNSSWGSFDGGFRKG